MVKPNRYQMRVLLIGVMFLFSTFLAYGQTSQELNNLQAFAKVYGYVKYFHPSDEAASFDWDRFAIYGAREVMKCKEEEALLNTFKELFAPIAPGVSFFPVSQTNTENLMIHIPPAPRDFLQTFWQHQGVSIGMRMQDGPYKSIRVNRPKSEEINPTDFGNVLTSIPVDPYLGKQIKWTGAVKLSQGSEGTGHLWLRVDLDDNRRSFFENMDRNPIKSTDWETYEIIGKVDEAAKALAFGCFFRGRGKLLVDDLKLFYQENEEWLEIPLGNNGFEEEDISEISDTSPWVTGGDNYKIEVRDTDAFTGKRSVSIEYIAKEDTAISQKIFDTSPSPGEWMQKEITENISCIIPISLFCTPDYTYPKADEAKMKTLQQAIKVVDVSSASLELWLGNVINAWNVFQHFYPYFDVVDLDWQAAFGKALKACYSDEDYDDFLITLQEFTAPLKDGHIFISGGTPKNFAPPMYWEWIENQLVITQVLDNSSELKKGDIIQTIDGIPARTYFDDIEKRISAGTGGWLNYRARSMALLGEHNTELILTTKNKTVALQRSKHFYQEVFPLLQRNDKTDYKRIDDNIIYLNIGKIEMATIESLMPDLQNMKAIICDLRGYPNRNHDLISHLLAQPDTTAAWMQVPRFLYPDQENRAGFTTFNWLLPTKEPHLNAKIVFITDGSAISYAESYMGYIEGYDLATIVGQPTAGTNGNVNPFQLPGDFSISWTGMKVLKHDGSQHHAIGIIPDILVEKSIQGLLDGRDEFLEKAIELAKEK